MKPFFAIALQTIRSAIRSKVFHVLSFFILLAVFLLPMTVTGDGTAMTMVQIALTYSLGITVALISATALWLSCSQLSSEIEKYSIHLVVTKPCPRWVLWLGKWAGIFFMHAMILLISAIVIYALVQIRVSTGDYSQNEIRQLDEEVRTGRKPFFPVPADFTDQVNAEYKRMVEAGEVNKNGGSETEIKDALYGAFKLRQGEVKPNSEKRWLFKDIHTTSEKLTLQFRVFTGNTRDTNQEIMTYNWFIKDPTAPADVALPFVPLFVEEKDKDGNVTRSSFPTGKGGTFQHITVSSKYIDPVDNSIQLVYVNPTQLSEGDDGSSVHILQPTDGPVFLVSQVSFFWNYCLAFFQALLQLAFLCALGCMVSAAFSTPVAAFVAITYLLIGLSVQAAIDAPSKSEDGKSYMYKSVAQHANHLLARGVSYIVVSVDDFDATSELSHGKLVTNKRIKKAFANMRQVIDSKPLAYAAGIFLLLLRWGVIIGLGIFIFWRRELGAAIRK